MRKVVELFGQKRIADLVTYDQLMQFGGIQSVDELKFEGVPLQFSFRGIHFERTTFTHKADHSLEKSDYYVAYAEGLPAITIRKGGVLALYRDGTAPVILYGAELYIFEDYVEKPEIAQSKAIIPYVEPTES